MTMLVSLVSFPTKAEAVTDTFTASGTWTAPTGVTSVSVEVWGGGGGSGYHNGGGGGGGAYSKVNALAVTPGNNYTVTVGAGGGESQDGGDSWFSSSGTVMAKGGGYGYCGFFCDKNNGVGGAGGQSSLGVGDIKYSGGDGGLGAYYTPGGGGGAAAGSTGNGDPGDSYTAGGGGGTGAGGGGNGGNGDDLSCPIPSTTSGTAPGGGAGSWICYDPATHPAGARGEVRVTYTVDTAERPLFALIGSNNFGATGWCYNMGTNFTPNATGYVDKLWYNGPSGTVTMRLYNASTQALLASGTLSGSSPGTWVSVDISPVVLTSGQAYVVAAANASCQQTYYSSTAPSTQGSITLNYGVYDNGTGTAFPSNNGGATYYGSADVTFKLGSPPGPAYNLTPSQSGNYNIGTTWGGSCSSSCTAGVDYPASSQAITIASYNVTLSANAQTTGVTISSGSLIINTGSTLTIQP